MRTGQDHVDALVSRWEEILPGENVVSYAALVRAIRAGRLVQEAFETVAHNNGLAVRGDYDVLAALRRALPEALGPSELATLSLVSNSGMTGRLDRLEEAGLVRRAPHPEDRRALQIEITDAGVETVDLVFRQLIDVAGQLLDAHLAVELERPLRRLLLELGDNST